MKKHDLLWKRSVSILIAAVLVICGCSVMAFAEGEELPDMSPEKLQELQEAINKARQAEELQEAMDKLEQAFKEAALGSVFPAAGSSKVYTLEQALALVGTDEGRENDGMLELSDDFSYLDPTTDEKFSSEGGKIIILWREKPLKKYETSFTDFPEDFNGTDEGKTKVYLCAELMERIPAELRASTPDEAENIVMAETFYLHSGTMTSMLGDDDEVEDPPTEEEIMRMFSEEESGEVPEEDMQEENAWRYVPFFTCLEAVSVYNAETGGHSFMDAEIYDYEELRRNPAAADHWDNMRQLLALIGISKEAESEELQMTAMKAIYDAGYYSFLEESVGEQLAAAVEQGDVAGAADICEREFWDMAETLKTLDPDASEGYNAAIEIQSYKAMQYIAGSRGYTSVAKSHDRIQADKSYTGQPDLQALNDMLFEAVDQLENDFEWDMVFVSLLAALG